MLRETEKLLRSTLTLILAGGQGERLYPLTKIRSKPSVPFGGIYRIIDFTLSNCLHSGLRKIYVLTQYKSLTLDMHIKLGWTIFNVDLGEFIYSVPPQQFSGELWYAGTADAVYQNIYLLERHRPRLVFVLSGDHIYRMDYTEMLSYHLEKEAWLTVAAVEVPEHEAHRFGILQVDEEDRIIGFEEKPEKPKSMPGRPGRCLANMGVYLFDTDRLVKAVIEDAKRDSEHDFGRNVIPEMVRQGGRLYAYNFRDPKTGEPCYWRDIGTIDSYYQASMDLVSITPSFNLYDSERRIRTYQRQYPPAKTVHEGEAGDGRIGMALNSIISPGCIISGGTTRRSILSYNVRVNSFAQVEDSILMENVTIGRYAKIRRSIIDEGVSIPAHMAIGYDLEQDARRFTVTSEGVVVVPAGTRFD